MDILNHAIAGASTGFYFNRPVEGAFLAILPDLVLGLKRKSTPNAAYRAMHSGLIIGALGFVLAVLFGWPVALFVVATLSSHLVLDIPTHGVLWGTRLLYPIFNKGFTCFTEWEFFNRSWWIGLVINAIWSFTWIYLKLR